MTLPCRLPWDPVYLVESLSDSTIYMAYYAGAQQGTCKAGEKGMSDLFQSQIPNMLVCLPAICSGTRAAAGQHVWRRRVYH